MVDGGVAVDDVVGALVVEDVLSATAVVGAALVVDARVVELVVDARVVGLVVDARVVELVVGARVVELVAALEVVLALTVELLAEADVADPLHDCVLVIVYGIVMVDALFPILKRPVAATGNALQTSILITPFTISCVRAPPLALNVSYNPLWPSVAKTGVIWDTS